MFEDVQTRRRYPRIPSENAVLVTKLNKEIREEFARTKTVGLGGCMITSEESFGIETPLELLINIARDVVKVRTRVAYERHIDGKWEIGVEFLELAMEDLIKVTSLFASKEED